MLFKTQKKYLTLKQIYLQNNVHQLSQTYVTYIKIKEQGNLRQLSPITSPNDMPSGLPYYYQHTFGESKHNKSNFSFYKYSEAFLFAWQK